jgi:hypothetical protein
MRRHYRNNKGITVAEEENQCIGNFLYIQREFNPGTESGTFPIQINKLEGKLDQS